MNNKICLKCKVDQPLDNYISSNLEQHKDNLSHCCKTCHTVFGNPDILHKLKTPAPKGRPKTKHLLYHRLFNI